MLTAKIRTITAVAASFLVASVASAALVPLEFTNISAVAGTTTNFSDLGDQWVATNVFRSSGPNLDVRFTITGTDDGTGNALATDNVFFDDVAARGSNMRVRVGGPSNVATALVFITIDLFETGTTDGPFWGRSDDLITQFSDLDSDAGSDRTDFGGVHFDDFSTQATADNVSPGSSLLVLDNSTVNNYSIARLATPWGPQANVSDQSASAQSPVTAAYTRAAKNSLRVVVGQLSNGTPPDTANRHIDIDMTPDFTIVPEPSSFALLAGLAGLGMAMTARRRRQ